VRRPLLALLLVTAGVSSSPAAENDRLPEFRAPERPGGIVPQVPSAGIFEALELGEAQYYSGELDAAAESLERAFARLEDHPEWLPAAAEHRIAVYKRLLALYRLRVERGGEGRDLADWLARHLTDQDPSVLSVPPMIEAALSGWRDAVRARSALLSVEVRDEADWEVYVDGRRLGVAPLRGIELPAGLHAVEARWDAESSRVRHRVLEPGGNRVVIEPALDRALVIEEGRAAGIRRDAALPLKIRAAGWLALAAGAEAAPLSPEDGRGRLLVVPRGRFVRSIPEGPVDVGALRPPGRWRAWTALGLGISAVTAGTVAAVLAGLRNREVRELNEGYHDTRPRIRRLEAGAWSALGVSLGFTLGAGGVGAWHLLDRGHPALQDLPPVD